MWVCSTCTRSPLIDFSMWWIIWIHIYFVHDRALSDSDDKVRVLDNFRDLITSVHIQTQSALWSFQEEVGKPPSTASCFRASVLITLSAWRLLFCLTTALTILFLNIWLPSSNYIKSNLLVSCFFFGCLSSVAISYPHPMSCDIQLPIIECCLWFELYTLGFKKNSEISVKQVS